MTIYPLIQAGEFSTISEGLTELDESLTNGKYMDYIEGLIDKLPSGLKTVTKYGIIARDTALYQGMARAVQYGDFLAKAALYEHLTKNQGLSEEQALERVTEEFVNFDFLPGRTRSYTESIGLTWFWNFKLRSMKVAMRMVKENPFRSLMAVTGIPLIPTDIGSPITDNFASVAVDGRLGYSMGYDMLSSALDLNPWYNLMK